MKHPQPPRQVNASHNYNNGHKMPAAKATTPNNVANAPLAKTLFSVTELTDVFKVEMPMPGMKREEFLVSADKNDLSIRLVYIDDKGEVQNSSKASLFSQEGTGQHIVLPDNADTEFAYAEYNGGVLRMHVPKTKQPLRDFHTQIVVY